MKLDRTRDSAMGRRLVVLWALIPLPFWVTVTTGGPDGLLRHAVFHPVYVMLLIGAILLLLRLRSATDSRVVRGLAPAVVFARQRRSRAWLARRSPSCSTVVSRRAGRYSGSRSRLERLADHSGIASEPDSAHRPHDRIGRRHAGRATSRPRPTSSDTRPDFFLSVRVLSRLFRRLFVTQLETAFDAGALRFLGSLIPLQRRRAFLEDILLGLRLHRRTRSVHPLALLFSCYWQLPASCTFAAATPCPAQQCACFSWQAGS